MDDFPFPDTSDLFQRKMQARLERAQMSFGQKIVILERMRKELVPFREAMHRARQRSERATPEN